MPPLPCVSRGMESADRPYCYRSHHAARHAGAAAHVRLLVSIHPCAKATCWFFAQARKENLHVRHVPRQGRFIHAPSSGGKVRTDSINGNSGKSTWSTPESFNYHDSFSRTCFTLKARRHEEKRKADGRYGMQEWEGDDICRYRGLLAGDPCDEPSFLRVFALSCMKFLFC